MPTRHGGEHISVELAAEGASAVVRVLDDGDPIPETQREAIFEPYTTLTTGRPVTGSIGLGLAVSRQLAVLMGWVVISDMTTATGTASLSSG